MNVELIIAPEVEQDFVEAYGWYESRKVGLGEEFLVCVDETINKIIQMPYIYSVVYKNYRRALTKRFPYGLFYEFVEMKVILYGIFHTSRDPEKWRLRLS